MYKEEDAEEKRRPEDIKERRASARLKELPQTSEVAVGL
jgi:hypothetical protein